MKTIRPYKGKDVEMLTTCATIIENAMANVEFLNSKRTSWTPEFFTQIKEHIDNAFSNYLGIDNASQMREATRTVINIQSNSLNSLAELKVQIEEDFKSDKARRDEILRLLGYAAYYKMAQNRDQEALIQLLYQFKTSLITDLRIEITQKGTSSILLDHICSYADELSQANITQEMLKGTKKSVTEEAVTEFVGIYNDVISIARIARNFYKGNPVKQDLFSYAKILKKLNAADRTANQEPEEE
jgi:hypothetical protein